MKEPGSKYPLSLFLAGVALNLLHSILWLAVSTVLLVLGRSTPWCAAAGIALLVLVVAVAFVRQLVYRHTILHSDTPEFADWQAAMLSPDWEENVKEMVERALNDDIELPPEEEEEPPEDADS
jgi:hypothetical protein